MRNARQLAPLRVGDACRQEVRNTGDGKLSPTAARLDEEEGAVAMAFRVALTRRVNDMLPRGRLPDVDAEGSFETGELLLHGFARPLGVSTHLALSTQFLLRRPLHRGERKQATGSFQVLPHGAPSVGYRQVRQHPAPAARFTEHVFHLLQVCHVAQLPSSI